MSDGRDLAVDQRSSLSNLSPLMRAQARAQSGQKINFCPFGCTNQQLDEHGYCKHLVGFTTDGKTYEPMVKRRGERIVQVPLRETGALEFDDETGQEHKVVAPVTPAVPKGAKLVPISVSSRVYCQDVVQAKKAS